MDQGRSHQPMVTEPRRNQFFEDLCKTLIAADIPLNKLSNPHFKQFLEINCKRSIPDQSTLRKVYVPDLYANVSILIDNSLIVAKLCAYYLYLSWNKYAQYKYILKGHRLHPE